MTLTPGRYYYDAIGRRWKVVGATPDVVLVRRAWRPWTLTLGYVNDDKGTRATILRPNGFTTIYDMYDDM